MYNNGFDNFEERQGQFVPDWIESYGVNLLLYPDKDKVIQFFDSIGVKVNDSITWEQYNKYTSEHPRSEQEWIQYQNSKRVVTVGKIKIDINKCLNDLD
jgi:hypothetical protein